MAPLGHRRRTRRLEGPVGALPWALKAPSTTEWSQRRPRSAPDALLASGIALVPGALQRHSVPGALLPSVIGALVVPDAHQAPRILRRPNS